MSRLRVGQINELADEAVKALAAGGTKTFPLVDGRVVGVLATPDNSTSEKMAMGISALPPNHSTAEHQHEAEEFVIILRGSGTITIDNEQVRVTPGTVVVTPPNTSHVTTSDVGSQLAVLWVYGPAGSEQRWLTERED